PEQVRAHIVAVAKLRPDTATAEPPDRQTTDWSQSDRPATDTAAAGHAVIMRAVHLSRPVAILPAAVRDHIDISTGPDKRIGTRILEVVGAGPWLRRNNEQSDHRSNNRSNYFFAHLASGNGCAARCASKALRRALSVSACRPKSSSTDWYWEVMSIPYRWRSGSVVGSLASSPGGATSAFNQSDVALS